MLLDFAKMHGLGNDFMVIELVSQEGELDPALIRHWGDRHTGVGFDQLLLIEPPADPDADFRYRIFNADGAEVEQCGNGARCAARYIKHRKLSPKPVLVLQTQCGPIVTRLTAEDMVEVDMGVPGSGPDAIPFDRHADSSVRLGVDGTAACDLEVDGTLWRFTPISIGNPHAVLFVDNVADAPVATLGPVLVRHPVFPEGANIGFCQVVDRGFLRLRVYERGVGETRACGTGACAAAVAAQLHGKVGQRVKVSLPGGKVRINWQGPGSPVRMTGPAALVFEGQIEVSPATASTRG
jgi:diaminopimelate epimerase